MKIYSRYILTEFTRILGLTLTGFVLIFLIVDFMEKIDNFMEAGLPITKTFYFFLLTIPSVIFYVAPVAVLVAVLVSLGLMARSSEIVAFKASGLSLYRLSVPIALAAIGISMAMFLISDLVIPDTAARVNTIWNLEVEGDAQAASNIRRNVWLKSDKGIYYFKMYDRANLFAEGVSIFLFDDHFVLKKRIEAAAAHIKDGQWELLDGLSKDYDEAGQIEARPFAALIQPLPALPKEAGTTDRASEEMSAEELSDWIGHMESGGYDPLRYLVDLQIKFSFPFICAIMAIIGLPIAFWKEKGGGIALGIGVGLGLSFVYLVLIGLSRAMGYAGLLPPLIAAWLPNLIFILLGCYLFTYVRQ